MLKLKNYHKSNERSNFPRLLMRRPFRMELPQMYQIQTRILRSHCISHKWISAVLPLVGCCIQFPGIWHTIPFHFYHFVHTMIARWFHHSNILWIFRCLQKFMNFINAILTVCICFKKLCAFTPKHQFFVTCIDIREALIAFRISATWFWFQSSVPITLFIAVALITLQTVLWKYFYVAPISIASESVPWKCLLKVWWFIDALPMSVAFFVNSNPTRTLVNHAHFGVCQLRILCTSWISFAVANVAFLISVFDITFPSRATFASVWVS